MARGPEGRLQDAVVRMFRCRGWLGQKNAYGAGWADFTFISPTGFILFAEFKAPTGELRPLQVHWHTDMKHRIALSRTSPPHMEVVIWDNAQTAYNWLQKYERYSFDGLG